MKDLFKTILKDFHHSLPVKGVKPRELQVPVRSGKIISLIGPRRSGKTFYFYHIINQLLEEIPSEQIVYLNFEDERFDIAKEHFQVLMDAYFELYPENIGRELFFFFDEIQEIEGWEKFVRRIYDTFSKNIFITGSSAKMLGKEIATHLRGRSLTYRLFPLSYKEFCKFKNIDVTDQYSTAGKSLLKRALQDYLFCGGFPELLELKPELIPMTLQSYFDVMIFRDIVERHQVRNIPALKYFIKRLFNTISSEFSINKIFNELKSMGFRIGKDQLYQFLEYVTDCFLFFLHYPYQQSLRKQQMGNKKIYAIDPGLVNAVTFRFTHDYGKLLENVVFLHLIRNHMEIYFTRNHYECDFLLIEPETPLRAIQVAYTLSEPETRSREITALEKAIDKFGLSSAYIITFDGKETLSVGGKTIEVLPAWQWLLSED